MNNNLLFFGELPTIQTHGVSLSNKINLNILKTRYNVIISEEVTSLTLHSRNPVYKLKQFIKNIYTFLIYNIKYNYNYFYSTLYLSNFGIIKNLITLLIFKLFNRNAQVIFHIHRSDFDIFYQNIFSKYFFNFINKFKPKFIVLSKTQLKYFKSIGIKNTFLLYNTIDINPENNTFVKVDNQSFKIVYISNYLIAKGVINLIDVFKKYFTNSNVALYCYGNFTNELTEIDLKYITQNNNNIFINGPVNITEKTSLIINSDLMVLPSHNEGIPLVLLECLALNKPIIISNVGFIEEVLGPNYPLYCIPHDITSIYEKIIFFLDNSSKYKNGTYFSDLYKPFSHENHKFELFKIFEN